VVAVDISVISEPGVIAPEEITISTHETCTLIAAAVLVCICSTSVLARLIMSV
jgi:hypothetical protein